MSNRIARRAPQQVVPSTDQALEARLNEAQNRGLEAATRIQAGAFATSVALQRAVMLSKATDEAFRVSPMGEGVYRSLLMAYGAFATSEIEALSSHGRRW